MYLDMAKNPMRELKTKEDYEIWAKECYNSAEAFYEVIFRCKEMIFRNKYDTFAVLMNVAFACELYLKTLLFWQNIDGRNEHDLYKLYKKLPEKQRNKLKELHPCGNTSKSNFELELQEIGKAFIVSRYMYERQRMACDVQFLFELFTTLHDNIGENSKE
ncbi:hypothetical protein [Anaerofustis sp. NSJ-163]|uniref:hypothetical protein n=1 Tax=Anaerofustis sp. NSJ-163 TaxID=2944391 RepID=UPI00209C5E7F|nr:hypothetical protein [Anaerofustis sp. NSJ-163]MCO8193075.1 hypothetical protein [Anaerofustis sp. NSJ-163]